MKAIKRLSVFLWAGQLSVNFLELLATLALTWLIRDRVAGAGAAADAEVDSATLQADLPQGFATAALGCVFGVDAAAAVGATHAKQRRISLHLPEVPRDQIVAAAAFARFGARHLALALGTAAAQVEHVPALRLPLRFRGLA